MGETRRAGWEKRQAGKTVDARRQRQVGSGAVGAEKKHAACCTTLVAHHFHFHPKSPSPHFQLAGFPASPPALAELGIGLGLRVPKDAGALALSLEAAGKHTAKRRCAAQDGSVETGLAKLIPGRWNGPPRECQAQCGSKTDRRNAAHGVTEGNWGISQSTNPVQLDGAIHAAPPSAALISTDRK